MRILLICIPSLGHWRAIVPVARALRERGHDVHCATGGGADYIARSGILTVDLLGAETNQDSLDVPAGSSRQIDEWFLKNWFVPVAEQALLPTLEYARQLDPDMILTDATALWGPMVAEFLKKPLVSYCPGMFTGSADRQVAVSEMLTPARPINWVSKSPPVSAYWSIERRLNRLRRSAGLPATETLGATTADLLLCFTTRGVELDGAGLPPQARCVGPIFSSEHDLEPFPDAAAPLPPADEPLVFMSLGNVNAGFAHVARSALQALAALDLRVVAANPRGLDLGEFRSTRIVETREPISQRSILRHAAAYVGSGGFNTVNECLCHGVPIVSLPIAGDEPILARRLEQLGLGKTLDEEERTPDAIARTVLEVLQTPKYTETAQRFAMEARLSDAVKTALSLIETLGETGSIASDPQLEMLNTLPELPRFAPRLELLDRNDNGAALVSALETYNFHREPAAEALRWLWKNLDGRRSLQNILADWPGEGTLVPFMASLAERGLLTEGDPHRMAPTDDLSERYASQIALFSHAGVGRRDQGRQGERIQEKLQGASIAVVGTGMQGSTLVRNLCAIGIGEVHIYGGGPVERSMIDRGAWYHATQLDENRAEALAQRARAFRPDMIVKACELAGDDGELELELPDECHLVVAAMDVSAPTVHGRIDEKCLAREIPWTSVRRTGFVVEIGPTIVPGQTGCMLCYERRRLAHLSDQTDVHRPANAVLNTPLGVDLVTAEIVKFVTGFGDVRTLGGVLVLDPMAMTLSAHRIFRLPRCPRCRPAKVAPTEFVWRPQP